MNELQEAAIMIKAGGPGSGASRLREPQGELREPALRQVRSPAGQDY